MQPGIRAIIAETLREGKASAEHVISVLERRGQDAGYNVLRYRHEQSIYTYLLERMEEECTLGELLDLIQRELRNDWAQMITGEHTSESRQVLVNLHELIGYAADAEHL